MDTTVPQRRLRPAVNEQRDGSESPDKSSGSNPTPKQVKRSKVTAVACQPCQKRKSKCDGARPVCSSCAQKNRTDCIYDSAADLRRTSALKQKIETLQTENNDLKDIILTICAAYGTSSMDSVLRLTDQTIHQGDFSHTAELAQLFRNQQHHISPSNAHFSSQQQQPTGFPQATHFERFQQMQYGFVESNQSMIQDGIQASQTPDGRSGWSTAAIGQTQEQEQDMSQRQRFEEGPYVYQQ